MSNEIDSCIQETYVVDSKLGRGAYGVVWKIIDKKSQQHFALKKCFDSFRNTIDAQRCYREVKYLQELRNHDNIVTLLEVYMSESGRDVYLVFDYMPTDLYVVIRSNILQDIHIQYITFQLLNALKYIHGAGLIHRDIKPSNILIDSYSHVKLCDFGLCRSIDQTKSEGRILTDYVATRYYRPPEVLLCSSNYSEKIDIWSAACIIGEMILSRPLLPGYSTMNQVERIVQLTGLPSERDLSEIESPFANLMLSSVSIFKRVSLPTLLQCEETSDVVRLMKGMLTFSASERYSAELALSHRYLSEFHNPRIEKDFEGSIKVCIHHVLYFIRLIFNLIISSLA